MSSIAFDSVEEAKVLKEFCEQVSDLGQDEETCLRFLRARTHDKGKAEDMLRQSIEWRRANNVDTWESWVIHEEIVKWFPYGETGLDNEGHSVIYIPTGRWDVRKFLKEGWKDEMMRNIIVVHENIMKLRNLSKRDKFVCVVDLAELTYHKIAHYETVQMVLQVLRTFESNYPETLLNAYVINAPWVFSYIWPIVKPLISNHTMKKIKIFDTNVAKWRSELSEIMPVESVPDFEVLLSRREMNQNIKKKSLLIVSSY